MQNIELEMGVFNHHLYEYEKGLRNLILYTSDITKQIYIEKRLEYRKVDYKIIKVNKSKINVFFGNKNALKTIEYFIEKNLSNISDEEDFILGILLGYDRLKQCKRFIKRKQNIKTNILIG